MASGTINKTGMTGSNSFGFPYTAPTDGIVQVRISAQSIAGASAYLYITRNGTTYAAWNGNANGGYYSMCFPVKEGDVLDKSFSNISTVNAWLFTIV